jgi:hypothetical protein
MSNLNRHKNYELLNLIGYGLSKFNFDFVRAFNFKTKSQFYNYVVNLGVAETVGTVKNRQDLFDGMVPETPRKGWWQKGPVYKHRKDYIDSLFGNLDANEYTEVVKLFIFDILKKPNKRIDGMEIKASPILRSQFKQMQKTGREAEYYFLNNYKKIDKFSDAKIDDARLLGDGYDFQLTMPPKYYLAEVKGVQTNKGHIRMTKNEFERAKEYEDNYALIIVCNLEEIPQMISLFNPIKELTFKKQHITSEQTYYQSVNNEWNL